MNKNNDCWQRTQGKNSPSGRPPTRSSEDSYGEPLRGASGTSAMDVPASQDNGLGTPTASRPSRPNKRNYQKTMWSVEEKRILLRCYAYSRFEGWSSGTKDEVFKQQIDLTDLDKDKIQSTTVIKLRSLMTQVAKYIPAEEASSIREEGRKQAERDFQVLNDDERKQQSQNQWSMKEKWHLIWAVEYAKCKPHKNLVERCKEWQKIFYHHCKQKNHISKDKLINQKCNFLKTKMFAEEQLKHMRDEVKSMIQNDICPLQNPIRLPPIVRKIPSVPAATIFAVEESLPDPNPTPSTPSPPSLEVNEEQPEQAVCVDSTESEDGVDREESSTEGKDEEEAMKDELMNVIEEVRAMKFQDRPSLIKLTENKKFKELLQSVNSTLYDTILGEVSITELNNITYGAALFIQRKLAPWYEENRPRKNRNGKKEYPWKMKLMKKIQRLRGELSQMMSAKSGPVTKNLKRKIKRIQRKYRIKDGQFDAKIAEHQTEIKGITAQIRNKERRPNYKIINKKFAENPRKVYRELIDETIEVEKPPKKEHLEEFWRPLFESPRHHQEKEWIETVETINQEKPTMPDLTIDLETLTVKIKQYGNFKSPGIDKIPNVWLKKLGALHHHYLSTFNRMINGKEDAPEWLTHGRTTLLPKSKETQMPSKYRPISCLNTTYKWLTGILADAIYQHLEVGGYLEEEQKGCIKDRMGTKDQLLINKTVLEDCKKRERNLSMAWIDYKKAFDSVPHTWISRCLELYKISDNLRNFLKTQMSKWETDITLNHNNGQISIPGVKIQRGIYQGDSLSPLLFCLTIDPLSKLLKKQNIGYNLGQCKGGGEKNIISHLLLMDDLKIYADSDNSLNKLVQTVHRFSQDICMDFGLDKCAKCTIRQGRKAVTENIDLEDGSSIEDLQEDAAYKYLGIEESSDIQHKKMREKIHGEYVKRVKKICKTELTPKNKITAINQLAVPVVTYGFGIVNWPQNQINALDVRTRKLLTLHKVTYRNQCLDRLYLPRNEGGLGLTEINQAFRSTIVSLGQYLICNRDPLMMTVARQHTELLPQNVSIIKMARNFGQSLIEDRMEGKATSAAKGKRKAHSFLEQAEKKERWRMHKRAGRFREELDKCYIDKKASLNWLTKGKLGFDGERMIMGAQDQALLTNGFKKMANISTDDKCRFCHEEVESSSHLVSGCQTLLADGHYTSRHNEVCKYLHWVICREHGIETQPVWDHQPAPTTAHNDIVIFYDKPMQCGRYIDEGAIKPDIVIWNKKERTAQIVEVTVPNDYGLNRAERCKLNKYQDLKSDLRDVWDLKDIDIIPVVVGATGLVKNNLAAYLASIPGSPRLEEVQLNAIKGTVKVLKRALGHKSG